MDPNHAPGNQKNDTQIEATSDSLNKMMATPPSADSEFSKEEQEFIQIIFELLENGTIDLHKPASLINTSFYDKANEMSQGKADVTAVNFLSKIRELNDLRELSGQEVNYIKPTYQAKYLVSMLKYNKETYEKAHGDMFII